ncbi:hypothetical protein FACS1894185_0280 [Betaproteobacteria bacterium]|nr:hypothetical protein FACS1894101_2130 [Betaproteobacteria bacterium]GHT92367.1 hypothetical protein AGMMS49545_09810 [Betaproteobacteria bacterium]GHU09988.1 hypothetical protein FACS1894185_0280 [Betaproteobacteria bacterium]GHU42535.1 hypothetical protein AGMMS50289_07400 [Betaproteobacteria bacterium]
MLNTENLFAKSELAARLIPHALMIGRLGETFAKTAPRSLAQQARVVNYRLNTVVIHANNGAIAAKLRQISQRLKNAFIAMGLQCNEVEVKVQPIETLEQNVTTHAKSISSASAQKILACAAAMPPDSRLAASLRELLERAEIREDEK